MTKRLLFFLIVGLTLTGCRLGFAGRAFPRNARTPFSPPISLPTDFPTEAPTRTPLPAPTLTATPTADLGAIGLPSEPASANAYDLAASACKAEWSNGSEAVPCNRSDETSTSGYVAFADGSTQELPPQLGVLIMHPPRAGGDTLTGKFPAFTVKKGDRFRAVLACRAHNFCDVEFGLDYYGPNGRTGLKHWSYLFADPPMVVDYPLDGIAGLTVQFSLSVRRHGEGMQAYAAWLAPHIYRP